MSTAVFAFRSRLQIAHIHGNGLAPAGLDLNERSEVDSGGAAALRPHGNGGAAAADDADSRDSAPAESWESVMQPDSWAPGWIKRYWNLI